MITKLFEASRTSIADRIQLAKDTTTSSDVLSELAQDKSKKVRLAVAKNPNTSSDILTILADEALSTDYDGVDLAVAIGNNPNTSTDTLLNIVDGYFGGACNHVRKKIAANKSLSPEVLKKLYDNSKNDRYGYEVISVLAKNPNTPITTLRAISRRGYENELAGNPSVPQSLLTKMYDDDYRTNSSIKSKIMKNPQMKDANRKQMLDKGHANSFDDYVGKDIWVEAYSYGISRDYKCYVRLISKKRKSNFKDEYTYNIVYDQIYTMDNLEYDMDNVEKGIINEYGSTTDDTDIYIFKIAKTYTTDELFDSLT